MTWLKTQIADGKAGKLFFPAVRKVRRKRIEIKKSEYTWGAPDYKLYPSGIKSWSACPKAYVKACESFNGIQDLDAIYRTSRGTAIHREYQEDFIDSELNAPEPILLDPRMVAKRAGNPCEVPFHDFETGFSGSADAAMLLRDHIIPIELKTTSLDEMRWLDAVNKGFPDRINQWIIQVCLYIYHFNKLKYYQYPIKEGRIAVLRISVDPAEILAEYEKQVRYEEFEEKISLLVDHYALERTRYISGEDVPCSYPLCKH